jgi:CheY-like chemotaxis protein
MRVKYRLLPEIGRISLRLYKIDYMATISLAIADNAVIRRVQSSMMQIIRCAIQDGIKSANYSHVRCAKVQKAWRLALATILVVDDDDAVRMMLSEMLETASHDVLTAENGIQALNCLRKQVPDVVILDIIMPEKEGFETIVAIRHDYPNLKIIAALLVQQTT